MRSISQGLGFEKVVTLASAEPVAKQKTVKQSPEIERVDPSELEYAYIKHPVTFNAINKSVQSIMSAGWKLECKDQEVLDYFNNFIESVGDVGENVTFEEILESIFKYQMIYGNAYIETVLGKNTKSSDNIVDLVILDPKRIDYAKISDGQIALDDYGKPLGYIQQLPFDIDNQTLGDPIPEGSDIGIGSNALFLNPSRICQFKLYTYGDRFYGQGLIEAGFKSIVYETMIKKAHTNSIEQKGEPPIIDYVGDEFHPPTPQQIDNARNVMKEFKYNKYFAFPYWHKIEPLNYKTNGVILDSMKYLREDMGASLGMPMAFATGSGESTNRSTLTTQHLFLTFTLNDIVKKTLATLKKYVFKRICEFNGFKEVPNIVWGYIGVEEMNEKSKRIVEYAKAGIIRPEEARKYVIESERLEDLGKIEPSIQEGEKDGN